MKKTLQILLFISLSSCMTATFTLKKTDDWYFFRLKKRAVSTLFILKKNRENIDTLSFYHPEISKLSYSFLKDTLVIFGYENHVSIGGYFFFEKYQIKNNKWCKKDSLCFGNTYSLYNEDRLYFVDQQRKSIIIIRKQFESRDTLVVDLSEYIDFSVLGNQIKWDN